MKKKHTSLAVRAKKILGSAVILGIFLFPVLLSGRWVYGVATAGDKRQVYDRADIAAMNGGCTVDVADIKPFDEPLVTITFDDGWESVYSAGLESLEKNCIKSTQYILGDHYGEVQYLSEKQVKSMHQAGHEIASHSMTHPNLTTLTADELDWELGESDRLLTNKFGDMREFATPLGANDDMVLQHIKKYYRSHRNTVGDPTNGVADNDINVRETFDPYQINAYTVRNTTTAEDIHNLVEYTKQRKGWLILTYHQVDDSDAHYAVTKAMLDEHLALVKQSGLRTPVMGQVLDAIEAKGTRR